jgi:hypothetical protein
MTIRRQLFICTGSLTLIVALFCVSDPAFYHQAEGQAKISDYVVIVATLVLTIALAAVSVASVTKRKDVRHG